MLRYILVGLHVLLAGACVFAIGASTHGHSGDIGLMLFGVVLFAAMAVTIWLRSVWVLLPGCFLILAFASLALVSLVGSVWPEPQVAKFLLMCMLMLGLEAASLVNTITARQQLRKEKTVLKTPIN